MFRVSAGALLAVFLFGLVNGDCPPGRDQSLHHEAQLHKDLLCGYNSDYRPVKNHTSVVTVRVRFAIKYLSFDALEEVLTIHSWVAIAWKDEFLYWDPADYGDVKEVLMESHEIWIPRMALFNADASMYASDRFYTTCSVDYTGNVTCVPHIVHYGICRTSLRRWPYDIQNCTMYFGSWMHKGEQINFTFYKTNPVVTSDFQNGPDWKLLRVETERLAGNYSCCPNDTYPMLQYTFFLKREAAGPAAIVVIPSMVVVMMTLTSITLGVKDNVRLMLLCFSMLGHFTFITEIGYNIPKHGADTPILLLFVRDSMLVTLTAILVTLLLMSITRRDNPAPRWIIAVGQLVTSGPGKYVIFTEFDPSDNAKIKLTDDERDGSTSEERKRAVNDWMQFANLLNSIMFVVIFLVYLILICAYIPRDD